MGIEASVVLGGGLDWANICLSNSQALLESKSPSRPPWSLQLSRGNGGLRMRSGGLGIHRGRALEGHPLDHSCFKAEKPRPKTVMAQETSAGEKHDWREEWKTGPKHKETSCRDGGGVYAKSSRRNFPICTGS